MTAVEKSCSKLEMYMDGVLIAQYDEEMFNYFPATSDKIWNT